MRDHGYRRGVTFALTRWRTRLRTTSQDDEAAGVLRPWIVCVAGAAALVRLAGLSAPLRADEAGFLLVARSWDPEPSSMFGHYWLDRPPLIIAVVRVADELGGPVFLRVVGAIGCGLAVILAAGVAAEVGGRRAAGWAAVAVAALVCNPDIDLVSVKGEQLGVPLVLASIWATLAAVRLQSWWLALVAGCLAGTAQGLKQNLISVVVFAVVIIVGARLSRRLSGSEAARIGTACALGVATPVLAQAGWVIAAGVDASAAWYAVYGFRSDATLVLVLGEGEAHLERGRRLLVTAIISGIAAAIVLFVGWVRAEWHVDPAVAAGSTAVVATEVVMVALGGSYWPYYLYALVPGTALAVGHLAGRPPLRGSLMRVATVGIVASSILGLASWSGGAISGAHDFTEASTGEAVAGAAAPGDTLVVFGGRADIQYAAGLPSPYPYLWSLQMRTLDPRYERLQTLLAGPSAPTWLIEWVPFGAWDSTAGEDLRAIVEQRYMRHGKGCASRPVYLLRGVKRPLIEPDCG
jgi:hypothetical protein